MVNIDDAADYGSLLNEEEPARLHASIKLAKNMTSEKSCVEGDTKEFFSILFLEMKKEVWA